MKSQSILYIFLTLFLFSCLTGCFEEAADLSEPKSYGANQITFQYPKNWQITDDSFSPAVHNLFIQTNGEAIVIVQSYQSDIAEDLKTFSKNFSESAKSETGLGKISVSKLEAIPESSGFESMKEEWELTILGESVPFQRIYGTKKIADRQVFIIFQVAEEDYLKAVPGFHLIRDTLKESEGS
jgi:hypothetical protein